VHCCCTDVALQVLFAQQLILFAPQAVPAAKHLPLLLLTLTSSRPALRRAAAATLRHLADRDAVGLAKVRMEAADLMLGRVAREVAHKLWGAGAACFNSGNTEAPGRHGCCRTGKGMDEGS
jgi:hypothetical protein